MTRRFGRLDGSDSSLGTLALVRLVMIGLSAGLVGGMLGVGGSVVTIPAMTMLLGPDQHLYQAAAMIVNFFVVVPAVYQHRRARAIHPATVLRLMPMAIVAVLAGVAVSEMAVFSGAGESHLRKVFGLFLLTVAGCDLARLIYSLRRPARSARRHPAAGHDPAGETSGVAVGGGTAGPGEVVTGRISWRRAALVAVPTGLLAGLLGVGGGMLAVPLQQRVLGIGIRQAIANSATIIVSTSLVGATAKNYALVSQHGTGWRSFALAGVLIPMAILGSVTGSRLTHIVPVRLVKAAFFVLLMVVAVRLTFGGGG